jgi:hypothetical protein
MWTGLIRNEVLRQCDALDGVRDGIIEHPEVCKFRPEVLHCAEPGAKNCLTAQQVNIVRQMFSPLRYKDQTVIYPGMNPGSELRAIDRLYAGKPFSDSQVSPPHLRLSLTSEGLVSICCILRSSLGSGDIQARQGRRSVESLESI